MAEFEKINLNSKENTFRYANETFSGCDMTAAITINTNVYDQNQKKWITQPYTKVLGELQTVSYSIHMEKRPIRSIGNVNAKDYVMGPRTIAGSLVFSVFNKHFAEDIITNINAGYKAGTAFLVDELPPFDITISAANEYGYRSSLVIYGVRLLNEGQVMSINDVYTENTYQYFATDIQYLTGEMFYVRDKEHQMYKLNDNLKTNKYEDTLLKGNFAINLTDEQKEIYEKLMNRNITLRAITKQPTRVNGEGIVNFSIDPYQDDGKIYVNAEKDKSFVISIKGDGGNKINKASISLPANKYTVYYENINGMKSNILAININSFLEEDLLLRYAPVAEMVSDTEIKIFSNEPNHNKASISSNGNAKTIDLVNRRGIFTNLTPGQKYSIFTYNDSDNMNSKTITVETLSSKDKIFNELINYCYANSSLLAFKNINDIYVPLINEAKLIAEKSKLECTDSLLKLKEEYNSKISNQNDSYEDNVLKVKQINELIDFSLKLFNNYIEAINEDITIPTPTMILDDEYNHVFTFDEKITSAEFYRNYGNIIQFDSCVLSYNFKNIKDKDNSFKFIGKPGVKYYVEALEGNKRSAKLEFYVMTQKEKENLINKSINSRTLSDKEIANIDNAIKYSIATSSDEEYKRSFIINAKKINNPILPPPEIEDIGDNITVSTNISKLIANKYNKDFFIALASYEDVLSNRDIYKIKFSNKDKYIHINKIMNGLKKNKEYGIWIEDFNCNQISNVSTFIYSNDFDVDSNSLKEYEMFSFIDRIKNISKNTLPLNIHEDLVSILENNQTLTTYNFIEEILKVVIINSLNKDIVIKFLNQLKYYIGLFMESSDILTNIKYNNGYLSFNSLYEGSLLVYDLDKSSCSFEVKELNSSNLINTSSYNNALLIAINDNMNVKSKLILINNKEKYMEVI